MPFQTQLAIGRKRALPNLASTPALSGMLSPLPYLGAAITWTARCCGQDRRNEVQRPAAEEGGSGLAAPCSRWLWLGPCISYALATARIYIRGACLGHAGLGLVRPIPLAGV